jgi:hypothetical protein
MSRILGILLVLGLTASLLGCGILDAVATGSEDPHQSDQVGCLDGQFFMVEWYVDNGTGTVPLACVVVPASHVEFVVNTSPKRVLTVIRQSCSDGSPPYNFAALSNGQIPAGAAPTSASLISDIDGNVLSTETIPLSQQVPIPSCSWTEAMFHFSLQ